MKMVGVFVGDKGKVEVCYIFSQELSAKVRPVSMTKLCLLELMRTEDRSLLFFGLGDWQI